MKVQEFIEKVNANKSRLYNKTDAGALPNFIKQTLEVKDYISIVDKQRIAIRVLDGCSEENNGIVEINSFQKYFLFTINILQAYTNLQFTIDGDIYGEYDELCHTGLLDVILGTFEEDYARSNAILNMAYNDLMEKNNIVNIIDRFVANLNNSADKLITSLAAKVENTNLDIDSINIEKLKEFLK